MYRAFQYLRHPFENKNTPPLNLKRIGVEVLLAFPKNTKPVLLISPRPAWKVGSTLVVAYDVLWLKYIHCKNSFSRIGELDSILSHEKTVPSSVCNSYRLGITCVQYALLSSTLLVYGTTRTPMNQVALPCLGGERTDNVNGDELVPW